MKREPTIHINLKTFVEILGILDVPNFPVEAFFTIAKKKAITFRSLTLTTKQAIKQANQVLVVPKDKSSLVADIIYSVRIQLHHKGVKKITMRDVRSWGFCNKLAKICSEYCETYSLPERSGYIDYVKIGLGFLTSFREIPRKLISLQERVFNYKSNQLAIEGELHPYKPLANKLKDYFVKKVVSSTGLVPNYSPIEDGFHFYKLAERLTKEGISEDYSTYIDTQFEAMAQYSGIPYLSTLYNDKSMERYIKYRFKVKSNNKPDSKNLIQGSIWDQIK